MKNLAEFKKLIERYESITLEEIEKVWFMHGSLTANKLIGFGKISTCPLCGSEKEEFTLCKDCVWAYNNEWLYVFGFATHVLSFKVIQLIGKTDIYNVLATGGL